MHWLSLALIVIFFNALMDFFVKLSSDKIHSGWGGFLINLSATLVLLVFLIYSKFEGERVFETKPGGILYSVIAGLAIGVATIFFLKMFAAGTNLSIGVPFVRIGVVIFASLLGILLLREGINFRYFIGFLISLGGLYLIITSR